MKGNEKSGEDEILGRTHNKTSQSSPMRSVARSVVWRDPRNELWLVVKRGSKEKTKTMKGRDAVVKGEVIAC